MYVCTYVSMYLSTYLYVFMYICICVFACIFLCMYLPTYLSSIHLFYLPIYESINFFPHYRINREIFDHNIPNYITGDMMAMTDLY